MTGSSPPSARRPSAGSGDRPEDRRWQVRIGSDGIREFAADAFLLATGGFESGALSADSYHDLHESIFDLPLRRPEGALVHGDYWGDPQPLFTVGVETDPDLRVRHPGGAVVYDTLYAAGGILAGATRWQEKSGEGIALASAVRAADSILAAADNATTHGVTTRGAAS